MNIIITHKLMFKIGRRLIGPKYPPIIIVELGINHNGNINLAKKIVLSAKKAGAEIIKHQTHIAEMEMSHEAKNIIPVHADINIFEIIKKNSISEKDEINLKKFVKKNNMMFISTPFPREAAMRLNKIGVPAFTSSPISTKSFGLVIPIKSVGFIANEL